MREAGAVGMSRAQGFLSSSPREEHLRALKWVQKFYTQKKIYTVFKPPAGRRFFTLVRAKFIAMASPERVLEAAIMVRMPRPLRLGVCAQLAQGAARPHSDCGLGVCWLRPRT
jgi:hypothetical protein